MTQPLNLPSPWTVAVAVAVAVADGASPANPSTAYLTNAHDRDDAIARVHAHHTCVYGWAADRMLNVPADPGIPPADAWFGWIDVRGINALRPVLEPGHVRQLARLRLRRWHNMMDPYYAAEDATGQEIAPRAWHAYSDEAEAICRAIDPMLFGQVSA